MAHPYKQKYNNFNGPGHNSPAESGKLVYKILEKAYNVGKNLFKRSPKNTKFVPVDSPKGWKKIQEQIGKRYVDDAGKLRKTNVATDFGIYPTLYYQATEGEGKRKLYDRREIEQDNTAVDPKLIKELDVKQNQKDFWTSDK